MTKPYFVDDLHALRSGMVIGKLLGAGLQAIPERDDLGNFTGVITLVIEDEKIQISVLP